MVQINRICSSFCRKEKKLLARLTQTCPADARTQTLFHKSLLHRNRVKPQIINHTKIHGSAEN